MMLPPCLTESKADNHDGVKSQIIKVKATYSQTKMGILIKEGLYDLNYTGKNFSKHKLVHRKIS